MYTYGNPYRVEARQLSDECSRVAEFSSPYAMAIREEYAHITTRARRWERLFTTPGLRPFGMEVCDDR